MKRIISYGLLCLFSLLLPITVQAESTPAKTTAEFLRVRRTPEILETNIITSLIYGTDITIIERSGTWFKISYNNGAQGWVSGNYVDITSEITLTDAAYCGTLVSAGFDASYCPYLSHLHKIHPNWVFTPLRTGREWSEVIDEEDGKNVIYSSNSAYVTSQHVEEGYYYVNRNVNSYFIDPRNFLTESSIFMFEELHYNSSYQTASLVKQAIPSKSYLYNDTYANYFVQAAINNNVSPIHLVARVVQEGGSRTIVDERGNPILDALGNRQENYKPITGHSNLVYEGISLNGYYNYYNIGAYTTSDGKYGPQTMGLQFACGTICGQSSDSGNRPWKTQESAIINGAQWVVDKYVNKAQNTLYFQKFNTNPLTTSYGNNIYSHQYMTNISAPFSEAVNTVYEAYKDDSKLDSPINFVIPVYENMPNALTQPNTLSNNNYLSSLNINGELIDIFDRDILSYEHYVTADKTSVDISGNVAQADATVTGLGTVALTGDTTTATIVVTAQNGSTKTYTVSIIKVNDTSTVNDIIGKMSVRLSGLSLGGFQIGTSSTSLKDIIRRVSPSTKITVRDSAGNIKSTENLCTGYTVAFKTLLKEEQTRTVAVTGDVSGDGNVTILDLLKVQKHLLGSSSLSGPYKDAGDANFDSSVNLVDLLKIQKYLLGSGSL